MKDFYVQLTQEAQLQNISCCATWDDTRSKLRDCLLKEAELASLLCTLVHAEAMEGVLYFNEQAIPCILHLVNLTLLKMYTCY